MEHCWRYLARTKIKNLTKEAITVYLQDGDFFTFEPSIVLVQDLHELQQADEAYIVENAQYTILKDQGLPDSQLYFATPKTQGRDGVMVQALWSADSKLRLIPS